MRSGLSHRCAIAIAVFAAVPVLHHSAKGQEAKGVTLEETAATGDNYDKAVFRLWYPNDAGALKAAVVLVPGSNGDGRPMVDDTIWKSFATSRGIALVGCRFTDKPHEQSFLEQYVDASKGSCQHLDILSP